MTVPKAMNSLKVVTSVPVPWPGMKQAATASEWLSDSLGIKWGEEGLKQDGLFLFLNNDDKKKNLSTEKSSQIV